MAQPATMDPLDTRYGCPPHSTVRFQLGAPDEVVSEMLRRTTAMLDPAPGRDLTRAALPEHAKMNRCICLTTTPTHRNATDLFADRWASDLSELAPGPKAGGLPGFRADPRPGQAAAHLGVDGRLDGYEVLELGPLEGGRTCQLEALGAKRITAVESN